MSNFKIRFAAHQLKQGKIVAYPTEAVYGLGCDPLNKQAVLNLLTLKQRPIDKGLILIASELKHLKSYVILNESILKTIKPHLHEPITWVIPVQKGVPYWLTGSHNSLAVRVTQHPIARQLCVEYGGAIVSTSANINTQPAAKTARQLLKPFGQSNVHILHGDVGQLQKETAIYDAITGKRFR